MFLNKYDTHKCFNSFSSYIYIYAGQKRGRGVQRVLVLGGSFQQHMLATVIHLEVVFLHVQVR